VNRDTGMQVVVIGGAGVLGQALLRAIVARGTLARGDGVAVPVQRLISVDRHQPARLFVDDHVEYVRAGPGTSRLMAAVMGTATDAVFHAWDGSDAGASVGESMAATLALVDSLRDLLEHCAVQVALPKVVLASSYAAQSGGTAAGVTGASHDAAASQEPLDSEGLRLRVAELLLADASRAGRVDGRSLRLAPIAGAPGRVEFVGPLLAALLGGSAAYSPVALDRAWCLTSAAAAAAALIRIHDLPMGSGPAGPVYAPARSVSITTLVQAAAARLGRPLDLPVERPDPVVGASLPPAPCPPPGVVHGGQHMSFDAPPLLEEMLQQWIGGSAAA
jgi:nucleoside-diphosphate-sugar epimerase